MRRAAWLLLAVAACDDADTLTIAPQVVTPAAGEPGAAFPDVDELQLSVLAASDLAPLVTATFQRGDAIALNGVPATEQLVVQLAGRLGGTELAFGSTCAFDATGADATLTPALFFSRTVQWARGPELAIAQRRGGLAVADGAGAGLLLGGRDAGGAPVTTIERFDPRRGGSDLVGELRPRDGAVAATLPDGRIAVLGGGPTPAAPAAFAELIEAAAGVTQIDDPRLARLAPAVSTLSDGALVVFGGSDGAAVRGELLELRPDGATLALRTLDARLATPRQGATATRLSDDLGAPVLIAGGLDAAAQPVAAAELYRPLRDAFVDPSGFAAALQVPRSGHRALLLPDGSVLIIGGVDAAGTPVRVLELFTLDAGFVAVGDLPLGAGVVGASATPLPDGRVLLAGGRLSAGGAPVDTAYIIRVDPVDGSLDVVATDRLAAPRADHQAVALCDGTILLAGGDTTGASSERYQPSPTGRR